MRALGAIIRTPQKNRAEIFAEPPRRILVIRQHNQMGDMLLAVPAFRAIKETFPGAHVALVSAPINRGVLDNNPYIDEVFNYESKKWFGIVGMVRRLRKARFDLVIVLHTVSFSFTSAALALLSGARYRIGSTSVPFGHTLGRSFYHLELPLPTEAELDAMSESEHNLYPLRAVGIDTGDLSPLIVPSAENQEWVRGFLHASPGGAVKRIALHPGAGKAENIWPYENFADVIRRLSQAMAIDLTLIQGPRDAETVAAVAAQLDVPVRVLRARPIGDVAAAFQQCDLVLCNDTGVMHVAAASGATTLAVFGPTDPHRWAPRCDNLNVVRGEGGDLSQVTPAMVAERALALLGAPAPASTMDSE